MTITEEQWNRDHAADICVLGRGPSGPDIIFILDTASQVAQELDRNTANALAARLIELAEQLPEPPRLLRRAPGVDRHLRALDG